MQRVLLISLAAVGLGAQILPGPIGIRLSTVSAALRQYLELTPEQTARVDTLNNDLRRFEALKTSRSLQVQTELREETSRSPLDAMALGVRYVELEGIRRETDAERRRTVETVQAVLTPAQRTRIAALQEVLRNYSIACDAWSSNLMTLPVPTQASRVANPDPALGAARFLLAPAPFCPTVPLVRTGDFTFTPALP